MSELGFTINENLRETLENQYLQPGEDVPQMLRRVADFVAFGEESLSYNEKETLSDQYYETMAEGLWMPSSPFLMNAGTKIPMLFACFVLNIEDDLNSIFGTLHKAAVVHKMGGGTGYSFSKLRAEGSPIRSTGGTSSGVLSFLDLYDYAAGRVKQGGRRRAANLGSLKIDHEQILDFIDAKKEEGPLSNFNLSVEIPDWFMEKVRSGEDYDLLDFEGKPVKRLNAADVFRKIVENNWTSAEPGVLFVDNINRDNKLKHLGLINTTNPCGEQPLLPWEACDLAAVNLGKFVRDGEVDQARLADIVNLITCFLDTAIDVTVFPTPEIEAGVKRTRKIGIGITGLHDMLAKLGLSYDSKAGLEMAESIMKLIAKEAAKASIKLAGEKGVPDGWYGSEWEKEGIQIRNLCRTTIAPTGTSGLIVGANSFGCEPFFPLVHERATRGYKYIYVNETFKEIAIRENFYSDELLDKIIANGGSVQGLKEVPEEWQKVFKINTEIGPKDHIIMQSVLQQYVDGGISKTINMPADSTIEDVYEAYMLAWSGGCKGLTIYRQGTRMGVVNTVKTEEKPATEFDSKSRPEFLLGVTSKIQSGCGKIWVTVNAHNSRIWEVFCTTGADGGCTSNIEEIARQISLNCRWGVPIEEIIDQLQSPKCARAISNKDCDVKSCSDAIARRVKDFLAIYDSEEWNRFSNSILTRSEQSKPEPSVSDEKSFVQELMDLGGGCRSGNCL